MGKTLRDSNFELLRIVSMAMIVFLHFGTHGLEKAIDFNNAGGFEIFIYYFLRSISIIAVNLYVLISGYFLINKKKNAIPKIALFIAEVAFFALIIYLSFVSYYSLAIDGTKVFNYTLSVFTNQYWFVSVYFALFILHPFINKMVEHLNRKEHLNLLLVLFFVCGFWQFFFHFNQIGVINGYGILSFIFLYLLGGYIKLYGFVFFNLKKYAYLFIYLMLSVLNAAFMYWYNLHGLNESQFLKYCNPLVILSSYALFMFFKHMTFKNKWVNEVSKFILYMNTLKYAT